MARKTSIEAYEKKLEKIKEEIEIAQKNLESKVSKYDECDEEVIEEIPDITDDSQETVADEIVVVIKGFVRNLRRKIKNEKYNKEVFLNGVV